MDAKFVFVALLIGAVVLLFGCTTGEAGRGLNEGPEVLPGAEGGVHPPCTDTDGGVNYRAQGTATGMWGESPEALVTSKTDACLEGDPQGTMLTEYYCSGVSIMEGRYDCSRTPNYVCEGGACVSGGQGCSETDNGDDALNAGTCTDGSGCERGCKDACYGSAVQEYYCERGACNAAPHGCDVECRAKGFDSGSCATNEKGEGYCECERAECSDTDADDAEYPRGDNPFKGGVCTSADGKANRDSCSGNDLTEYACLGDGSCERGTLSCNLICLLNEKGTSGTCKTDQLGLGYCECSAEPPQEGVYCCEEATKTCTIEGKHGTAGSPRELTCTVRSSQNLQITDVSYYTINTSVENNGNMGWLNLNDVKNSTVRAGNLTTNDGLISALGVGNTADSKIFVGKISGQPGEGILGTTSRGVYVRQSKGNAISTGDIQIASKYRLAGGIFISEAYGNNVSAGNITVSGPDSSGVGVGCSFIEPEWCSEDFPLNTINVGNITATGTGASGATPDYTSKIAAKNINAGQWGIYVYNGGTICASSVSGGEGKCFVRYGEITACENGQEMECSNSGKNCSTEC